MTRIIINNRAEPDWRPVIEAKLQIMLASMLANVARLDIELDKVKAPREVRARYVFKLIITDSNGLRYEQVSDQPDATLAIEAAMARIRRVITRVRRARGPVWRQASGQ